MNYPYKIPGASSDPNTFVADNTGVLGNVDQPLDARTLVTIDYSGLTPGVTVDGFSFRVKPGGEPQLWLEDVTITTGTLLSFYVLGGIGGQQYTVLILTTLADTEIRSDVLNVNVLGDGCGCCSAPMPLPYYQDVTSGDGLIITNTAPRFFVSATPPVGAHVLDRWYDTTTGDVSDYITNGASASWVVSSGGGGGGGGTSTIRKISPIFPDGSNTTFVLTSQDSTPVNIAAANYLFVSVDGVWQEPGIQYTAAANVIIFSQAPTADAAIFMLWFGPSTGI